MSKFRPPQDVASLCIDLRPIGLLNWSHALDNAVPLALFARDCVMERGGEGPTVILIEKTPRKARSFFEKLGFQTCLTSARVKAPLLQYSGDITAFSRRWAAPHSGAVRALLSGVRPDLPRKVFVDRRSGRHLSNGAEVREFLTARGYTTIYPEDFSLEEQLALFIRAEDLVAIHGAGLAPLLYRNPEDGPFRFVEIQSPGHMSGFCGNLVTGLPVDYRTIRGDPDKRMLADYFLEDSRLFGRRHSLSPFRLDMGALELVLRPERVEEIIAANLPVLAG